MKKLIYILIGILAAVYLVLSVLGSGEEYKAERLFYRTMKTNARIMDNPDVVPPKLLELVENNLKKLLAVYPKAEIAKTADLALAEFYIYNKRYGEALSRIDSIIKAYDKVPVTLAMAHFLKGQLYEKQDRWANALREYVIVRDDHTATELGMRMPLYIARYYVKKGRDADARQAYNDAALFYERLEKENSKKMLGYAASVLLIQTYMVADRYDEAGKALEEAIDKYGGSRTIHQLLPQVENIYVKRLKRPEKAIEIYKMVKEKTKDEKFKIFLDKKIVAISK